MFISHLTQVKLHFEVLVRNLKISRWNAPIEFGSLIINQSCCDRERAFMVVTIMFPECIYQNIWFHTYQTNTTTYFNHNELTFKHRKVNIKSINLQMQEKSLISLLCILINLLRVTFIKNLLSKKSHFRFSPFLIWIQILHIKIR